MDSKFVDRGPVIVTGNQRLAYWQSNVGHNAAAAPRHTAKPTSVTQITASRDRTN